MWKYIVFHGLVYGIIMFSTLSYVKKLISTNKPTNPPVKKKQNRKKYAKDYYRIKKSEKELVASYEEEKRLKHNAYMREYNRKRRKNKKGRA